MIQKTTWMRYLIIGGINLILFCLIACSNNTDYIVKADFIYYNDTNYVIYLESSATINPYESLKISIKSDGPKNTTGNSYVPPFPFEVGNIIKYDNLKCEFLNSGLTAGKGEGPSGIQNYESKKISERYYEFEYHFTEDEYNQAENCN